MKFEDEIWAPISGHKNHMVSNLGRVKSIDHVVNDKGRPSHRKGKIFKQNKRRKWYHVVNMDKRWYSVHRLVALHFIPNPDNKKEVNHIDGDKTNNRVDNLEWSSRSENSIHAYKLGLKVMSEEVREKISKSHFGIRPSEESIKKNSESRKGRSWGHHSESAKKKISNSIAAWHKKRKSNEQSNS